MIVRFKCAIEELGGTSYEHRNLDYTGKHVRDYGIHLRQNETFAPREKAYNTRGSESLRIVTAKFT